MHEGGGEICACQEALGLEFRVDRYRNSRKRRRADEASPEEEVIAGRIRSGDTLVGRQEGADGNADHVVDPLLAR
jgi:hypothetical protein